MKVLIAEDEENIGNFISTILKTNGYKPIIATTGNQAIQCAESYCPDVILLDLGLPDMDGIDVISEIRKWAVTPIIVISARNRESEKVKALDAGADDYITKPFNIRILIAKCINLLNNRRKLQERYKTLENSSAEQLTSNKLDQDFIDHIIRIVQTKLEEGNGDINVTLLCSELGLSRTKLFLKMKKITGESPHYFIQNIKLKTAAKMLRENEEYNISDISFQLGFYFGKSFKEYFGMSPTAYRKFHQEQKDNHSI